MKTPLFKCLVAFLLSLSPLILHAQMVVEDNDAPMSRSAVPRPNVPSLRLYEVKSIAVNTVLNDQFAETQVAQTIYNPNGVQMEAELLFPLPGEGAVQSFTLMVDGKEMPGRLLPKDEARQIYEAIVRRKQDPALMEYVGYGLYKTSIFPIPARGERTITLKYTQLCHKQKGIISFVYPFGTQKFSGASIGKLSFRARILSSIPLKNIYSPSDQISVDRKDAKEALVNFEQSNIRREKDFRLQVSAENGEVGMSLLSYRPNGKEEGYFMLLAAPEIKAAAQRKVLPKTVVFVLDRSGSMEGKKLEQAKEALKFVLNNLNEGDRFNIVDYDDGIQRYKPKLQTFNHTSRREALAYVENIVSGGGTNIHGALEAAMEQIQDDERPNYVLFLTDGLPTAGNTNEMQIAENTKRKNKHQARLFTFGVGEDVNARLLDRLVSGNGGRSEYVSLEDNLEAKVAAFYGGITSPMLSKLKIEISGTDVNRTYPQTLPDLFEGGQLVWVGRYKKSGDVKVKMSGYIGETEKSFSFNGQFADDQEGNAYAYVEKLWATRRIGFIIDQIDLNGQNAELIAELVSLSKKHGILTPYTSFLAEEDADFRADRANMSRAGESLKDLQQVSGGYANAQRAAKQSMMNASAPTAGAYGASETANESEHKPQTIQVLGHKTFYLLKDAWVDSEVNETDEKNAKVLKLLSDEYFSFARAQSQEVNQYLNLDRTTIVRINGQVYRIER